MFDILVPAGNEKELLARASELGITRAVLLYKTASELKKKKSDLGDTYKSIYIHFGLFLQPKSMKEAKNINEKTYLDADLIAATSQNEQIIRALCENPMIDVVFGAATSFGKDALDYRRSGMNAILANLMKQNKQSYAISFANILNETGSKRAKLLGREMQNIQLTRRKIPLVIASFATKPDELRLPENLSALLRILGASYPQSRAATSTAIENILKRKEARRSKTWVRAGVRVVN
jgi:RNase P/RNase MRP subunit p30